jgi:uncharacterized protein
LSSEQLPVFVLCLAAGFAAQLIDGSLGMGYGIILSIILSSLGLAPVTVSASVHVAKFLATGVSGISHFKFGNVEKRLMAKLALGGVAGAVVGSLILTSVSGDIIKPFTALYLTVMGFLIVRKALQNRVKPRYNIPNVIPLGVVGGFCDAIGGGGWGPIVTSSLLVSGKDPRRAIGSVSLAEFFVAVTVIAVLIAELPQLVQQIHIVTGLMIGSVVAAPIAAFLAGRVAARPLMLVVGTFVIVLSGATLISVLFGS